MGIGPSDLRRAVGRLGATVVNGLEVARFGGLRTDAAPSPSTVKHEAGIGDLRHYFPGTAPPDAPVVLLVPPLMLTAEVWDVSPSTSAVAALHERGIDPWVIDFGSPEHEEGGLGRTLADHVESVSAAVDHLNELTGRDVHLAGYSQGGMFCYQVAAYRRSQGVASVVTFGSPVDVHGGIPLGLRLDDVLPMVSRLVRSLFESSAAPSWVTRTGFKLLDPVKTVRARIDFVRQLHDRDSLLDREPQRRFLDGEGFVAWPGPALAEFAEQFVQHNRMLSGGFEIGGRMVTLADLRVPVLAFVGQRSVWRRVLERFAPAQVLEFYASTEGQAVLANLDSRLVGAKGRPLPGSVDVAVARYDLDDKRLVLGDDGLAQRAAADDVGLLLAREARGARPVGTSPLRSVFAPGDAWRSTGDLFRVDDDGVHWLVGSVGSAVRTRAGRVPLTEVEDALMHCPPVDLAVAYGLPSGRGRDVLAAAVTLVAGRELDVDACSRTVANRLPPGHVPTILRVVDDIETTTWFRPRRAPLREQGAPLQRAWRWHGSERRYRPLTAEDVDRLLS